MAAEGHRPRARRRRSATRCGATAARCSARSRAATTTQLPKKVERGALRAALAQKLQDGALVVVDALTRRRDQDEGGGRDAASGSASTGKAVLVDVEPDEKLARSVRNIAGVACRRAARVTARDVMNATRVVATRGALEKLQEALA